MIRLCSCCFFYFCVIYFICSDSCFLWSFCLIYIRTQFIMFGTAFYRNFFNTAQEKKTHRQELWLKVSSQQWLYNKRLCTELWMRMAFEQFAPNFSSDSKRKSGKEANIVWSVKKRNEYASKPIFHVITNHQVALKRMHVRLPVCCHVNVDSFSSHFTLAIICMMLFGVWVHFLPSLRLHMFKCCITKRLNGLWAYDKSGDLTDLLL